METFHDSLAMCDWPAVARAYDGLIASRNRCPAGSEHELIVVKRPVRPSPFPVSESYEECSTVRG